MPFWVTLTTAYPGSSRKVEGNDTHFLFYLLKTLDLESVDGLGQRQPPYHQPVATTFFSLSGRTYPPLDEAASHRPRPRDARRQDRAEPAHERDPRGDGADPVSVVVRRLRARPREDGGPLAIRASPSPASPPTSTPSSPTASSPPSSATSPRAGMLGALGDVAVQRSAPGVKPAEIDPARPRTVALSITCVQRSDCQLTEAGYSVKNIESGKIRESSRVTDSLRPSSAPTSTRSGVAPVGAPAAPLTIVVAAPRSPEWSWSSFWDHPVKRGFTSTVWLARQVQPAAK